MSPQSSLTQQLATHVTHYRQVARSAYQLTPVITRKPALIRHWLIGAHWAQLVLVIFLIVMPSLIPESIDTFIEQLSPPSATQKFVRFFDGLLKQQALTSGQITTRVIVWLSSIIVVLLLFWLHIPRATQRAQALAIAQEQQADQLHNADPKRSLMLYQSALGLTLDARHENSLKTKIEKQQTATLVHGDRKQQAATDSTATVFITPDADTKPQPLVASRYRIDAALGQGAMGLVHRAHDTVLARDIALKQLAPALVLDAQFVDRFRQEALALARLSHPHIVQIYDYIEDRDAQDKKRVWIAMELIEGDELAAHLQPGTPMPEAECLRLALQMSQAMAYAHEQGIVHRDFKPANVLISHDGNCKVMDFGLAKIAQSELRTQAGTVMGSPAFMSPEQAAGKGSDARSDIYALGVTLYLMCSGRAPFMGDAQAMLAQHLSQTPKSPQKINPALSNKFNRLILDMLAKSPDERPQTMNQVTDQLRSAAH